MATKIMVVDDEPDFVFMVSVLLKKEGYEVVGVYSGEECIAKLESEKPDCIILDIMMPGLEGYEVCRRIRSDKKTEGLPIVIVSVRDADVDVVKGIELGANDYFTKPFNKVILLAKIRSILKLKKMEQQLREYSEQLEQKVEERTVQLREAHEKLKHEYSALARDYDLVKVQMEHDEIKVIFIAALTGFFTAVLLLSLIILITTGNLRYLLALLLGGLLVTGLTIWFAQRRMKATTQKIETAKKAKEPVLPP